MSNILKWIPIGAVSVLLNCSPATDTDEQRIWKIANHDNHENSVTVSGHELDLHGLMSFRVVRASVDESFGVLSCVQHGYLIAFHHGRVVGMKRVDPIRDLRLPDPSAASSNQTSLIARRPDVLFTTEGATVGTDGYLLTYHMYEVTRTGDAVAFLDRWSDLAVDYETQAGFPRTIKLGVINLAIPPSGASSFYYVQSDVLNRTVAATQCVLKPAGIQCTPWQPRV